MSEWVSERMRERERECVCTQGDHVCFTVTEIDLFICVCVCAALCKCKGVMYFSWWQWRVCLVTVKGVFICVCVCVCSPVQTLTQSHGVFPLSLVDEDAFLFSLCVQPSAESKQPFVFLGDWEGCGFSLCMCRLTATTCFSRWRKRMRFFSLCVCNPVQTQSDHMFFTVMEKNAFFFHVCASPVLSQSKVTVCFSRWRRRMHFFSLCVQPSAESKWPFVFHGDGEECIYSLCVCKPSAESKQGNRLFFMVTKKNAFFSLCVCSPVLSQSDSLFFTVTEKDEVLGQVQMPVTSLSISKGAPLTVKLKSHRKCPVPHGELKFEVGSKS